MLDKIKSALGLYGLILPAQVKAVLIELGEEVDRLRAEVDQLKKDA